MRKIDDKNYDAILGNELRLEREAKKLSQDYVANKCGVSRATISAYELGTRPMNVSTLKCICDLCGLRFSVVLYNSLLKSYSQEIDDFLKLNVEVKH